MPTTVRRRTCPASPATRPQNVAKPGAVKHGRSSYSRSGSEAGRVRDGSIGGGSPPQGGKNNPPAFAPPPPHHTPKPPPTPPRARTASPPPPAPPNTEQS